MDGRGTRGTDERRDLLKVAQQVSGRAGNSPLSSDTQSSVLSIRSHFLQILPLLYEIFLWIDSSCSPPQDFLHAPWSKHTSVQIPISKISLLFAIKGIFLFRWEVSTKAIWQNKGQLVLYIILTAHTGALLRSHCSTTFKASCHILYHSNLCNHILESYHPLES